jgi:hypothetical protein
MNLDHSILPGACFAIAPGLFRNPVYLIDLRLTYYWGDFQSIPGVGPEETQKNSPAMSL